jgi:thymidylate synthase (FAD)
MRLVKPQVQLEL